MVVDSEAPVAKSREVQAAGKVSNTTEGGLARLVFGQGLVEENKSQGSSEEGIMRLANEISSSEKSNPDQVAPVDIAEIQLDLAKDEEDPKPPTVAETKAIAPEETAEEKIAFIRKVFLAPLLSRVEKFISEKQAT